MAPFCDVHDGYGMEEGECIKEENLVFYMLYYTRRWDYDASKTFL